MDVPRVLVVDLSARFGGSGARALGLVAGMPEGAGAVACLEGTGAHLGARDKGLEHFLLARHKWDPRIGARLRRAIRAGGFDVVDTQNVQSKLWATVVTRLTGTALVSTLNSWYEAEHGGSWKGRLYQRAERATARWTDMFVAVAPDIRDRLRAAGVDADRIALIGNAIEPAASTGRREEIRRLLSIPPGGTLLCAVGRLVPAKGHQYLIAALQPLTRRYPGLHCVIVGDGDMRSALEARVTGAGLAGRVVLTGFRPPDETHAILDASDLFVMPSVSEGTPIAVLEAGARGKPIVATRVGGVPNMLTDGIDALLVAPADPAALAAAIGRLLDDGGLMQALGEAVRDKVRRTFTRDAQVEATLAVYRQALARRRRMASAGCTTSRTPRGSASTCLPSTRSAASGRATG